MSFEIISTYSLITINTYRVTCITLYWTLIYKLFIAYEEKYTDFKSDPDTHYPTLPGNC